MSGAELAARTEAGRALVELAARHGAEFLDRAAAHDAAGRYVAANVDALKTTGFLAGTTPTEFGGLGVDSLHDLVVAISRLARGCPSTAIAANMHLGFAWHIQRAWRYGTAEDLAPLLKMLGTGQVVTCHAGTEPGGRSLLEPATQARACPEGYLLNGRKMFATNSEIADLVTVYLTIVDADGKPRLGSAAVPRGTAGMTVLGNWDALGMRGSGSHDVVFTDCLLPADAVRDEGPVGAVSLPLWAGLFAINFPLVGTYLGIAEYARELAVDAARRKRPGSALASQVAEIEVALATARAVLERAADVLDECLARPDAELTQDGVDVALHEFQAAKLVVNRSAAAIVDAAMTVVGGASFRTGHPLGRLYRDVRAGPFMAPYSTLDGLGFLAESGLA